MGYHLYDPMDQGEWWKYVEPQSPDEGKHL